MIWVEGKSSAWTYLSELELIPFVKNLDSVDKEKMARIAAEDEIEKKAEELRQKVLASSPKTYFPKHTVEIETYSSSYKMPEEEIQFIDHRKEKSRKTNAVLGEFLLTCFVIGLFMVGIYKGKSFLGARHDVQESVATQLNSNDQHAAQKNKAVSPVSSLAIDTAQHLDSLSVLQNAKQKSWVNKKTVDSSISKLSQSVIATAIQENKKDETKQPALEVPQENSIKKDEILKKEIVPSVPEIKTNNEPVKEEKKGFLKGLFKKKKKDGNIEEKG
jgi:hypothetical protein